MGLIQTFEMLDVYCGPFCPQNLSIFSAAFNFSSHSVLLDLPGSLYILCFFVLFSSLPSPYSWIDYFR